MTLLNQEFADLLTDGIYAIKECEGKRISIIQDELGYVIGRKGGAAIERWRKGHLPPDIPTLERLTRLLMERTCGKLSEGWFRRFLHIADHPSPENFLTLLFPSDYQQTDIVLPKPPDPPPLPQLKDFTGRQTELSSITKILTQNKLTFITGMAGVGKTAIAIKLVQQLAETKPVFWHAFHKREGVESVINELAGFLAYHGEAILWETLQSSRLMNARPPEVPLLFGYLFQLLRDKPYVLCFDDFEFLDDDPNLILFIERLQSNPHRQSPWIIITSRRMPSFVLKDAKFTLSGVTFEDAQNLMKSRNIILSAQSMEILHEKTDGNVQFLILAIDALHGSRNQTHLISRLANSTDIEGFLMKEVHERLDKREQVVMEAVAILHHNFGTQDAIEFLLNQVDIQTALTNLCQRHLLTAYQGVYGREYGQHAIVQAFFYERISRRDRRAMHRLAGEFYETEELDLLRSVYHYQQGYLWQKSADLMTTNFGDLINSGQARPMMPLLEAIQQTQLQSDESWVKILITRGRLMTMLGESENAEECLQDALDLLADAYETMLVYSLQIQAYSAMGELKEQESPFEAVEWLQKGLEIVQSTDREFDSEKTTLLANLGTALMHTGNYKEALNTLKNALSTLPQTPSSLQCNILKNIGAVYFIMGDITEANEYSKKALNISRKVRDYFQTANILINSGVNKYVSGDWASGIIDLENGLEIAERIGNEKTQSSLLVNLGAAYINLGQDEKALKYLTNGYQLAVEGRLNQIATIALFRLGDLHVRRQEWDVAEHYLLEGKLLAEQIGANSSLVSIIGAQAECALGLGQPSNAYRLATEAVNLARKLEEKIDEGINLRILGQALVKINKLDEAIKAFSVSMAILENEDLYEAMRTKFEWGNALLTTRPEDANLMILQAHTEFKKFNANRDRLLCEKYIQILN